MAEAETSGHSARQVAVAIALTAVAGFVDTFGYVTLDHVFTAQMSGNTVLIAVHAGTGQWAESLLHLYTVGMFFLGLLASGAAIEIGIRCRLRRVFALAMLIEAMLLAVFAGWGGSLAGAADATGAAPGGWPRYVLVALAALSMGAQNTSLRMAGVLGVYTTHVTGALTRLSEDLIVFVFSAVDRRAARRGGMAAQSLRQLAPGRLGKIARGVALIGGFLGGAGIAVALMPVLRWSLAMVAPLAVVLAVAILDLVRPLGAPRGGGVRREEGGASARH